MTAWTIRDRAYRQLMNACLGVALIAALSTQAWPAATPVTGGIGVVVALFALAAFFFSKSGRDDQRNRGVGFPKEAETQQDVQADQALRRVSETRREEAPPKEAGEHAILAASDRNIGAHSDLLYRNVLLSLLAEQNWQSRAKEYEYLLTGHWERLVESAVTQAEFASLLHDHFVKSLHGRIVAATPLQRPHAKIHVDSQGEPVAIQQRAGTFIVSVGPLTIRVEDAATEVRIATSKKVAVPTFPRLMEVHETPTDREPPVSSRVASRSVH